MIDIDKYQKIKERFGWCGSWAIWAAKQTDKPKDGISDLSVFDPTTNSHLLDTLHSNYVAVGLNISRSIAGPAFSNFHSGNPRATDYKIRHAFEGTPLWGAYMTDILKDFEEVDSSKAVAYLKDHPEEFDDHAQQFKEELDLLQAHDATLVAFGRATEKLLRRLGDPSLKIISIKHYAYPSSAESYRSHVLKAIQEAGR